MLEKETSSLALRGEIHRIYQTLATAPTLAPSPGVDRLFSDLVRLARADAPGTVRDVLDDPIVCAIQDNLRRVCSNGEYLLESHWARHVVECSTDAWGALRAFPYFENYRQLCRLEVGGILSLGLASPKQVLFVGAGPLPLTSMVLAKEHALPVTNVDTDSEACRLASRLAERLGLDGDLDFVHADILDIDDFAGFDLIVLASLVGLARREKTRVLEHLGRHTKPGTLLVLRSAARLRTLLYPRIDLEQLGPFEPLLEIHPHHDVINSVIIARRRS